MVLAHELAHLRRRDHWVRLVELVVSVLHWWNPLVWWVRRRLHAVEEQCCDAWVAWVCPDRSHDYAESLLKAAELPPHHSSLLVLASPFLHTYTLKERIEMVLKNRSRRTASRRVIVWLALLAAVVIPAGVQSREKANGRTTAKMPVATKSPEQPDASPGKRQVAAAALVRAVYENQAGGFGPQLPDPHTKKASLDGRTTPLGSRPAAQHACESRGRLKIATIITTDWAWDETRIYYYNQLRMLKDGAEFYSDIRIWNGKLALERGKSATSGEHYVLGNKAGQFFEHIVTHTLSLPWGAMNGNRFWWLPVDVEQYRELGFLQPEDFERIGDKDVNGKACRVVESRAGGLRLHIGVEDRPPLSPHVAYP